MIITRLCGGLGNQLFQYAVGLRLALARRTRLKLDLSRLDDPSVAAPRSYELAPFQVSAELASPEEIAALTARSGSLRRRAARKLGLRRDGAALERHFQFDPQVASLPDDVCLDGYWQSERYFAEIADRARREFTLEKPPEGRNAELSAWIASCNAVSLHVRRGDYVTDPATHATHGVCSLDYYRRAVETIRERVADPVFFLFSDDPEWTRAHLEIQGPVTVVDHNGPESCQEDLRLMSQCAHHIVANSSFSWWGAWLGGNPGKIAIAPERWFADATRDTSDLIPAGWLTR